MGFLISDASAQQGGAAAQGDPTSSFGMLSVLFAVFYFLLLRPQQKRQKEHQRGGVAVATGGEVVPNGGRLGRITTLGDNFITLEVAEGTSLRVQRSAVASLMPKGTLKSAS